MKYSIWLNIGIENKTEWCWLPICQHRRLSIITNRIYLLVLREPKWTKEQLINGAENQ